MRLTTVVMSTPFSDHPSRPPYKWPHCQEGSEEADIVAAVAAGVEALRPVLAAVQERGFRSVLSSMIQRIATASLPFAEIREGT